MENIESSQGEIFSYHIVKLPLLTAINYFIFPPSKRNTPGLKFSLCLFSMNLGQSIFSPSRYKLNNLILIARWSDEPALNQFLKLNSKTLGSPTARYIKMKPYRIWGKYKGLGDAPLHQPLSRNRGPVIGLTLAKLRLSQTLRFIKWGIPVEKYVKTHNKKWLAIVSHRPLRYFSTFSIWENEKEMLKMVNGGCEENKGCKHKIAMQEMKRMPFHHEFITMRLFAHEEFGDFLEDSLDPLPD